MAESSVTRSAARSLVPVGLAAVLLATGAPDGGCVAWVSARPIRAHDAAHQRADCAFCSAWNVAAVISFGRAHTASLPPAAAGSRPPAAQAPAPVSPVLRQSTTPAVLPLPARISALTYHVGEVPAISGGRLAHPTVGSPDFTRLLDVATGTVARAGNRVKLLFNGKASFAERYHAVEEAKTSIDIQSFIWTDDETGWHMGRLLARKAQEGVRVRVIIDSVGSHAFPDAMRELFRSAGVDLREYGTIVSPNYNWHEKHFIVDGKFAICGGMNIGNNYAFGGTKRKIKREEKFYLPWRDTDVRVQGPAVTDIQRAFLRNWQSLGGSFSKEEWLSAGHERFDSEAKVRVLQSRPMQEGVPNCHMAILSLIRGATRSLWMEQAYFSPTPDLMAALCDAARRGVDVRVATNSDKSIDVLISMYSSRWKYDELLRAGVRIFEIDEASTLHSKTIAVDGRQAAVGSANVNGRSSLRDSEVLLSFEDDPEIAAELERHFGDLMSHMREFRMKDEKLTTISAKMLQWLASRVSDMV